MRINTFQSTNKKYYAETFHCEHPKCQNKADHFLYEERGKDKGAGLWKGAFCWVHIEPILAGRKEV